MRSGGSRAGTADQDRGPPRAMRLLIIRHAIAVPRGTPGIPDDERPLTPAGRKRFQTAARGLARVARRPDVLLTSPLPRALATNSQILPSTRKTLCRARNAHASSLANSPDVSAPQLRVVQTTIGIRALRHAIPIEYRH